MGSLGMMEGRYGSGSLPQTPLCCRSNAYIALQQASHQRALRDAFFAIAVDDEEALRKHILEDKMSVNEMTDEGSTLLHHAANYGSIKCARLLLEWGANTKTLSTENRWTSLHQACYSGHVGMILLLCEYTQDPLHTELVGDVCVPPAPQPRHVTATPCANSAVPDYDGFYPLDTLIFQRKENFDKVKHARRRILEYLRRGTTTIKHQHDEVQGVQDDDKYTSFSVLADDSNLRSAFGDDSDSDDSNSTGEHRNGPSQNGTSRRTKTAPCHPEYSCWSTEVISWGKNNLQLGYTPTGQTNFQEIPHPLRDLSESIKVVMVSAGPCHSLLLTSEGTVYSWGVGRRGRLGLSDEETRMHPTPINAFGYLSRYKAYKVSCGDAHSLAATNDGTLWAWGCHKYGQLGIGVVSQGKIGYATIPTRVEGPFGKNGKTRKFVRSISAGSTHSAAVTSDGNVWTWGSNKHGQLGQSSGSFVDDVTGGKKRTTGHIYWSPVQVSALTSECNSQHRERKMAKAVAGDQSTVFLSTQGLVWQCGYGNSSPVLLKFSETGCVEDTLGECFTDATTMPLNRSQAKDAVFNRVMEKHARAPTCGTTAESPSNRSRSRTHSDTSEPTNGSPDGNSLDKSRIESVSSQSNTHNDANDGSEMDFYGSSSTRAPNVGTPTAIAPRDFPHPSVSFTYPRSDRGLRQLQYEPRKQNSTAFIQDVTVGKYQGMALDRLGRVWTWGTGTDILGHPYRVSSFEPRQLTFFARCDIRIVSIAAGAEHCIAVSDRGDVYTWGKSCLGTSSKYEKLPCRVPSIANVISVSSAGESVLAICGYSNPPPILSGGFNSLKAICEKALINGVNVHNACGKLVTAHNLSAHDMAQYALRWISLNLHAVLLSASRKDLLALSAIAEHLQRGNYKYRLVGGTYRLLERRRNHFLLKQDEKREASLRKFLPIDIVVEDFDSLQGTALSRFLDEMLEAGAHRLSLSDSSFSDALGEEHKDAISAVQSLIRSQDVQESANTLVNYVVSHISVPLRSFDPLRNIFKSDYCSFLSAVAGSLGSHEVEGRTLVRSFKKRPTYVYQKARKAMKVPKVLRKKLAQTLLSIEDCLVSLGRSSGSTSVSMEYVVNLRRKLDELIASAVQARPAMCLCLLIAAWSAHYNTDLGITHDDVRYIRYIGQCVWDFYQVTPLEIQRTVGEDELKSLVQEFKDSTVEGFVQALEQRLPYYRLVSSNASSRISNQSPRKAEQPVSLNTPEQSSSEDFLPARWEAMENTPITSRYILPAPKKTEASKPVKFKLRDFLSPPQDSTKSQQSWSSPAPWSRSTNSDEEPSSPSIRALRASAKENNSHLDSQTSVKAFSLAEFEREDPVQQRKQNYLAAASASSSKPSLKSIQESLREKRKKLSTNGSTMKSSQTSNGHNRNSWGFVEREKATSLSAIKQQEADRRAQEEAERLQAEEDALVQAAIRASKEECGPGHAEVRDSGTRHERANNGRAGNFRHGNSASSNKRGAKAGQRQQSARGGGSRGKPRGRGLGRGRGGNPARSAGQKPSAVV
eukprot:gb/GECG01004885.1/.p1 GENE.gb/GECG01004885.1/~~gb/GECG01004885.1/.p1  ORF type:complete len:1539 (+),score=174.82 gb/GECG01004885.1/:1-4617(+)